MRAEGVEAYLVRSTTDLWWLTGFEGIFDSEEAHAALITEAVCVIHTDSRYSAAMRVAAAGTEWAVEDTTRGVSKFLDSQLGEDFTGTLAIAANTPLNLYRAICETLPAVKIVERDADILNLRATKEPEEVAAIQEAMVIAAAAFEETIAAIRPGMTEREVSLKLEFAMRARGADELAFANIVAAGPNSANPHAVPGSRRLQEGDLVVIDFGARTRGYRSDTTRTIAIGQPSAEQLAAYEAVREANEAVQSALCTAVTGQEMHELAEEILAEHGFANKMGHGLGHGVGLDIHELPVLNPRNSQLIPEGAIVTVEPGVYLPGQFGIRIEDFGLVTSAGFTNFCPIPRDLIIIPTQAMG